MLSSPPTKILRSKIGLDSVRTMYETVRTSIINTVSTGVLRNGYTQYHWEEGINALGKGHI